MNKVTITIFTTPGCPHCEAGRVFLRAQGADYVDRDVSADPDALRDMLFLLGRSEVPALYVGYRAAIGFDPGQWLEVLAHGKDIERKDPFRLPEALGDDPLEL